MPNKILFIRHAEAEHNISYKEYGKKVFKMEKFRDSPLTENGISQCENFEIESLKSFDLVICSPSIRALQTCHLLFRNKVSNIIVSDLVTEINTESIVNKYRDKNELEIIFPNYDYSYLNSYDYKSYLERKYILEKKFIPMFKNKNIAIISHGKFMRLFHKEQKLVKNLECFTI